MTRLLLRGDDAGSCPSANRAITEACRFGLLKNVSVTTCGPAFAEAALLLRELPMVCLGLHVTLNAEWVGPKWGPVAGAAVVPSLVDGDGYFLPHPHSLRDRGFVLDEAEAEAQAQLDRMRDAGLRVTYLDEHMGVGSLPGLRERLHYLADREGLLILDSNRCRRLPALPETGAKSALTENILARLEAAPDETYLYVTHPGCDEPDMQAFYLPGQEPGIVARERDAERRLLTDPVFAAGLAHLDIPTLRFDNAF